MKTTKLGGRIILVGVGYIDEATGESHGWDSMWQRFMDRVIAETKVEK